MTNYLSHPLANDTPLYGGAKTIHIESETSIQAGDTANSLILSFPNHTGTHVDVPYLFPVDRHEAVDIDEEFDFLLAETLMQDRISKTI